MAEPRYEYCSNCGGATGRAGKGEDSIYWLDSSIGPLCEECNATLRDEVLADSGEIARLAAENAALKRRIYDDNAVCLCGCAPEDHESYGEDGESCEHEDHACIRVCVAVAQEYAALRAEVIDYKARHETSGEEIAYLLAERGRLTAEVERLKKAITAHLCPEDAADWIACTGDCHGEPSRVGCAVCEGDELIGERDASRADADRLAEALALVQTLFQRIQSRELWAMEDIEDAIRKCFEALAAHDAGKGER